MITYGPRRHGDTEDSFVNASAAQRQLHLEELFSVPPCLSGLFVTALAILAGACQTTPPKATAPSFDVLITNAQIVDGTGGARAQGVDRDCQRQDCRGRRSERNRSANHRRERPHRRARLHRHAQPLRHDAHHRRQRPEQDPPGRDDGSDRRVGVGGAAQSGVGKRRHGPTSSATSPRSKRTASRRTCCRTSGSARFAKW